MMTAGRDVRERLRRVQPPAHDPALKSSKVLVADDGAVFQRLLRGLLERWGYPVVVAENGARAWELLRQDPEIRLAVIDWVMPELNGLDLCRLIRNAFADRYIYILMMTAQSDPCDLLEGMEAGADDYLTKPFDTRELKLRLRAASRILAYEEQYRVIAETASDGIITADEEGTIRFANSAAAIMFGYGAAEMRGLELSRIVPRYRAVHRAARSRRAQRISVALDGRHKKGRRLALEISFSRFMGPEGERGITAVVRNVTQRKEAERRIQEMNRALRELTGRLMRLQDEAQRRLARELHDSTGQNLVAIAMNLSSLERQLGPADERARQLVEKTMLLTEQCVHEVRSVSHLLHPPLLDEFGLSFALRSYIQGFSERTGIQVDIQAPDDSRRLPEEIETTLFRIVQEGLANIHRHSGAPRAWLEIELMPERIRLRLADNGRGIARGTMDGLASRLGVGILGMRERAQQLGGHVEISSSSQGTTVAVELPCDGLEIRCAS
jgi:PAS domain S-box-containing protein